MPRRQKLELCNQSFRITATKADLKKIDKQHLVKMLFILHLVRQFETYLLDLQEKGLVHGPVHTSIG